MAKYFFAMCGLLLPVLTNAAKSEECRLISSTKDRMACFDAQEAVEDKGKKHSAVRPKTTLDTIENENRQQDRAAKSLCRGC